ncbi:MAG: hydrogenase maturation protease [Anaerolineaceae bacterium]|nr:MAG: hydrogenase maturation protease [Anaerolineaceae bacterium]
MKTLVIGLGNPILGDDGVGWRVAEEVAKSTANRPEVEVDCYSLGGLSLMERLTGCERAILIDSIFTGTKPVGTVSRFPLNELPDVVAGHTTAAHDTSLRNALNVGRSMDIPLPRDEDVSVVAVEAENVYDFSETLSPPVEAAVPLAVQAVLELLDAQPAASRSDNRS